jgi:hypothetical protein
MTFDAPPRKRLRQLIVSVVVTIALYVGAFAKGVGPCGPNTSIGFVCIFALPVAMTAVAIFGVLFLLARFINR